MQPDVPLRAALEPRRRRRSSSGPTGGSGSPHGRAFALYVAGYTAGRFVIELLRTDPATRVFGDVRINVVVAAVVFVGAVIYLVVDPWPPP